MPGGFTWELWLMDSDSSNMKTRPKFWVVWLRPRPGSIVGRLTYVRITILFCHLSHMHLLNAGIHYWSTFTKCPFHRPFFFSGRTFSSFMSAPSDKQDYSKVLLRPPVITHLVLVDLWWLWSYNLLSANPQTSFVPYCYNAWQGAELVTQSRKLVQSPKETFFFSLLVRGNLA